MAKVIRATPTLRGLEANIFIENIIKNDKANLSQQQKKLFSFVKVTPFCSDDFPF
jgi:hypothetical protein